MRIIVLFLSIVLFYSCNNSNLTTIGQDLIDNDSYVQIIKYNVDKTSTIKLDSFATSTGYTNNTLKQFIIGSLHDRITGFTSATPYFQVVPTSGASITSTNVYDSLTFSFTYTGETWGDTTKIQTYYLHRLKRLPILDREDDLLYNHDTIPYETQPLGTLRISPYKERLQNAVFRIKDDVLGRELYEMAKTGSETMKDDIRFMKFFRGLTMISDAGNTCLISVNANSDSLGLNIHYHDSNNDYIYGIHLADYYREYNFNNFTNKANPPYDKLVKQSNSIPFAETQEAFTQGLDGYMLKVQLPIAPASEQYKTIIKVELEFKPTELSFKNLGLPPSLWIYTSNARNQLLNLLTKNNSNNELIPIAAELVKDPVNPEENRYVVDLTDFYDHLSKSPQAEDENYLVIGIPSNRWNSSFNRLIINELPTLKIYYAKYE